MRITRFLINRYVLFYIYFKGKKTKSFKKSEEDVKWWKRLLASDRHLWGRRRCLNRQRAFWLVRASPTGWPSGRPTSRHSRRGPADLRCSRRWRTLFPELYTKRQTWEWRPAWSPWLTFVIGLGSWPVQMSVWFLPQATRWTFSDFRAERTWKKGNFQII